ncbi:RIO1 family regulatory kinase/ATPase domain-containing protein [Oceanobacillus neutriphilus]|uniref:non-specific serine/threonine protein kinase n=1 Tax=Oceanobacillus neutriphilus TaxID=531815 RepID=A0ABQ2P0B5_9BACI|nr:RIO1 family regulatory kinase/ATPase [Oceanobacillus neutriphilus]GGP14721.1 putative serine/threonine-protein kinase YrzF [Oceanobacillus neutriphilus]
MKRSRYDHFASTVLFAKRNGRIKVLRHHDDLKLYGTGRSAAVFKIKNEHRVIKIFYPAFEKTAIEEKQNYEKLNGSHYYPNVYEAGTNYLVMDFIEGKTFFECLAEGIPLKPHYIEHVDNGLQFAKAAGLNPSDIHLHNLILTKNEEVRIIDVARFSQEKMCTQWEDLKDGYTRYYQHTYFPKKIPRRVMYSVSKLYRLYKYISIKKRKRVR